MIYDTASDTAGALYSLGRRAMWGEGRDVNWNLLIFALTLLVLLALATRGVPV